MQLRRVWPGAPDGASTKIAVEHDLRREIGRCPSRWEVAHRMETPLDRGVPKCGIERAVQHGHGLWWRASRREQPERRGEIGLRKADFGQSWHIGKDIETCRRADGQPLEASLPDVLELKLADVRGQHLEIQFLPALE